VKFEIRLTQPHTLDSRRAR